MRVSKGGCCFAAKELLRCPSQSGAKAAITSSVSAIPLPKCMWMYTNLPLTFSGRRAPMASPLGVELPPHNRSWVQSCAGFLVKFPLHGENRSAFQRCCSPNLLSEMVFISVPARILVTGWYKCCKRTNVGPARAGPTALSCAFENNELDCQSPRSARRENENPAAPLLSLQLQLPAVATIQLKFPPVRKVFGNMEMLVFFFSPPL